MISLIWAMDNKRLIGADNQIPWHLPADMAWFRAKTLHKSVLMGRKTFDSMGKPLPKRKNIVLSRQSSLSIEGCSVIHALDDLLTHYATSEDELMVMGGSEVYALCLPFAQRLYCTTVEHAFAGDAWFPEFDLSLWSLRQQECHQSDENNKYNYRFEVFQRA